MSEDNGKQGGYPLPEAKNGRAESPAEWGAALLLTAAAFFLCEFYPGAWLERLLPRLNPGYPPGSGYGMALCALAVLGLYRLLFPRYEGSFQGGHPALGFRLGLLLLVSWAVFPLQYLIFPFRIAAPTFYTLGLSLMSGLCEETAFRAVPLSFLMRGNPSNRRIAAALLFSAVCFALVHLTNLLAGADPGSTLVQTAAALGIGLLFGAVFLRCGSLWPTVALHVTNNLLGLLNASNQEGGVLISGVNAMMLLDCAVCLALGAAGLYLVRPEKRGEIRSLWAEKWHVVPD